MDKLIELKRARSWQVTDIDTEVRLRVLEYRMAGDRWLLAALARLLVVKGVASSEEVLEELKVFSLLARVQESGDVGDAADVSVSLIKSLLNHEVDPRDLLAGRLLLEFDAGPDRKDAFREWLQTAPLKSLPETFRTQFKILLIALLRRTNSLHDDGSEKLGEFTDDNVRASIRAAVCI